MGERQTVGFDGSRRALLVRIVIFALTLAPVLQASAQESAATCSPGIGRVIALQGNVEIQRGGQKEWVSIQRLDTALCADDRLRTDAQSRAVVSLQPETMVRVDQNTVIRLKQSNDEIEVEFFGAEHADSLRNAQPTGAGYFITRFPKKFKVTTPHMNAAVEGTEFMVQITPDATKLTVLEGKVSSRSIATGNTQLVAAGESVLSGTSGPGTIETVVKPLDAVQWVLRYPPISDQSDTSSISRAEKMLRAGSVGEALAAIDAELATNSINSDALALRAVILVAKNDKAGALASAHEATDHGAENYRAWLALSYAEQASFELEAALGSARKAEALRIDSALAHARVAELLLSLGDMKQAEDAARSAVLADSAESYAHSVLGFVHLGKIETGAARSEFASAIERDSFSALPRLGLGLAKIRDGELVAGREEIEVAVTLDPSSSLLRSYIGKAYFEENKPKREELALVQMDLAKSLDERDPTPYFYEAILRQALNQPIAAIDALHESIAKNDNRAVYRSRLQLDDDIAARSASLSAIYGELGFGKLAIFESAKAISDNPGNFSAHNLLATAYANLPRHDIARVSEVLQAQIRQPASLAATPPVLGVDNLAILRDAGPSQLGVNEFSELFNRDGVRFEFDGLAGDRDTFGDQAEFNALAGTWAARVGQLHYETEGFQDNDAATKEIYTLLVQKQLNWNTSVQLDARRTEFIVDQTFFRFDSAGQLPVTIHEDGDSYRLSGHVGNSGMGDWIWTAAYENPYRRVEFFGFGVSDADVSSHTAEVQNWSQFGGLDAIIGLGYIDEDTDSFIESTSVQSRAANAYFYGKWSLADDQRRLQLGAAADWYRREHSDFTNVVSRERLSPKAALTWSIDQASTVRFAAFSAVRRPFVSSQTIEPTQVAGFNQYFSGFEQLYGDVEGSVSERVALALDHYFFPSLVGGIEVTKRRLEVPSINLDRDFNWHESTAYAYLYKSVASLGDSQWSAVLTAEGEFERIERPQALPGSEGIRDVETFRVPVAARVFQAEGLTFRLQTTYVKQSGTFSRGDQNPIIENEDSAWIFDAAIDYQLPRRHGIITLGLMNIGDDFVDLIESDVFNPRVAMRRFAFLKFKLSY